MTSIAGYSASDFIGPDPKRNWAELIHPDDREASRAKVLGAPTDGSITEVEYRIQRADGSYAWILSRLRKFVAEDESLWVHGAALDVTARHEAEDLRRGLESAKYAGATRATVEVVALDGVVTAEMTDDGRGGADAARGSGLRGLADRLEAIGGSLDVVSPPGGGTVVRARVPLESQVGSGA
jgi:PAS domain S-box-containing protein